MIAASFNFCMCFAATRLTDRTKRGMKMTARDQAEVAPADDEPDTESEREATERARRDMRRREDTPA